VSISRVAFSKANHLVLKERLLAEYPDLDEQTLADTLEGLTDLNEIIAAIIRSAVTDEALADGLRERLGEMQARLSRLEDRACRCREMVREVMVETDLKKVMAPDFTISLRSGSPGLLVTDEAAIPKDYWIARDPRLDRQGLHAALKNGAVIVGAVLSNPEPVLSVRVK
jgi:hypothetical protein